jgi:hypothetical protein
VTPRLLGSCALRERDIVYSIAAAGNATVAAGTSFGEIKVLPMHLPHFLIYLVCCLECKMPAALHCNWIQRWVQALSIAVL